MTDTSNSFQVKSATRTLDIIEYVVAARRPMVAQEISAALSIPVSSLSYLLATLVERHYLEREGRRYRAGSGLVRLQAHSSVFTLADTVAPLTRTLRVQLNETSSFFIRHEWELEALVTETSDHALRYAVPPGTHAALHSFAAGKALLATMDEQELGRFFAEVDLQRFTDATLCNEQALRAEVETIRVTGIARTLGEHTTGIVALARAAKIDDAVVGAFSVAIPTVRFDAAIEARVTNLLVRTVDLLATS